MHAIENPAGGDGGASGQTVPATSGKRGKITQAPIVRQAGQVTVRLPPPPSVNNLYAGVGKRRVKSARYRSWQQAAGWELLIQKPGRITGPWEADITLPRTLRGDIDNRVKGLIDLLVTHCIVADDKFCERLSIAKTGDAVVITVRAAT